MCGLAQQNVGVAWVRLKYDFNRLIKAEFLLRIRQKAVHQLKYRPQYCFCTYACLLISLEYQKQQTSKMPDENSHIYEAQNKKRFDYKMFKSFLEF